MLIALANGMERSRVAVTASRGLGGAVERNRSKRVLRAAMVPFLKELKPGFDLILISRKAALPAKSQELQAIIQQLLHKANILH